MQSPKAPLVNLGSGLGVDPEAPVMLEYDAAAQTPGRVLLVDPDAATLELLERRLRGAGFDVDRAARLDEALAHIARAVPDAVFVGALPPDADGLAGLRALRAAPALAGVAIAVMVHGPGVVERALQYGADDCLRRPFDTAEVILRAGVLVRLRRHAQRLIAERARLSAVNAELSRLAIRDPLTGMYNRRCLEQRLVEEVERSRRYGQSLALIIVDVDHFKKVNDTHGHTIGDAVLRSIGATLQSVIRKVDLLARYGGEEFVVVAPATSMTGARILSERLRAAVAELPIIATTGSGVHASVRMTASFGVVVLEGRDGQGSLDAGGLLEAADAALYRAKRNGRNRVEFYEDG